MATHTRRQKKTYECSKSKKDRRSGNPDFKKKRPSSESGKRPKKKQTVLFTCATPKGDCSGRTMVESIFKVHSSHEEVIKCKVNYLLKNGYKRLSKREYINPENGRILVLSRKAPRAQPVRKNEKYLTRSAKFISW